MPGVDRGHRLRELREYIDRCAECWLGYDLPPAQRAVDDSGWSPDPPDVFCRRCGDSVGRGEQTGSGCAACRGRPGLADAVVRLGAYAPPLQGWVVAIKYDRWSEMGEVLGGMLGRAVRRVEILRPDRAVIVPAPMPWLRRLHRGIDHARVIAAAVATELHAPTEHVLACDTGPAQVTRSSTERRRRGGAGMRARRSRRVSGRDIVLVDDVRTTGGTARAAVRHLRRLGAERVILAVLAVRDDPSRSRPTEAPSP